MKLRHAVLISLVLLAPFATAPAQDRPVAISNARILTVAGDVIERGTVVLRGGKIEAVGSDVDVPAGAEIVDARGGTLMPGLVHAWSRAGLGEPSSREQRRSRRYRRFPFGRGGRSSGPKAKNEAAKKVAAELYARQDVYRELLQNGVTTLALVPEGPGFPGRAAVVDPSRDTREEMTVDDDAFVVVEPATGTDNKKLLKEALEKARKIVEEREKPKEPAAEKKAEEEGGEKEAAEGEEQEKEEGGEEPPKPGEEEEEGEKEGSEKGAEEDEQEKKAPEKQKKERKDPNIEVLADLLQGKTRGFFSIPSALELTHFRDAVGEEFSVENAVLVVDEHDEDEGRIDEVTDRLGSWKVPILVTPELTTPAYSDALVNPAARLVEAGFEVGLLLGDSKEELRELWFELMQLVRAGMPRDEALAAVTLVPARALGLEQRVGSIEKGKEADLLLLSADPLDPAARLVAVWHDGHRVEDEDEDEDEAAR